MPLVCAGDRDGLLALLAVVEADLATPSQRAQTLECLLALAEEHCDALVASGLGTFANEDPRARDALFQATRDPDPFVRYEAAGVIGSVRSNEAISVHEAMTYDDTIPNDGGVGRSWSVGEQAKRALAKIHARLAGGA